MIRDNSPAEINKAIDQETLDVLEQYEDASPEEVQQRILELEKSFDLECFVEMAGGALALAGGLLAIRKTRLGFIPAIAGGLVLSHSLPFWDPLTPLFRLFGIWSRQEIEREKFALKLLRGDFDRLEGDRSAKSALAAAQGEVGLKEGGPMRGEKRKGVKKSRGSSANIAASSEEPGTTHAMPLGDTLGEDMKPGNLPTVSGPSGDITRH